MTTRIPLLASATCLCLASLFAAAEVQADAPPTLQWISQLGTPRYEVYDETVLDDLGNIFVAESKATSADDIYTKGDFLHKFDLAGNRLWTREIGTSAHSDQIVQLWADNLGGVYLAGATTGDVGGANAGDSDTTDAYLRKYDSAGDVIWTTQTGTAAYEYFQSVAGDGLGNLYVGGLTDGSLAAPHQGLSDAIVGKYDGEGNLLWMRQFGGSSYEDVRSVAADDLGNVFLSGGTHNSLGGPNSGDQDAFLAKYDSEGNSLWFKQYGTAEYDGVDRVASDGAGHFYALERIGGFWSRTLSKYDGDGNRLWTTDPIAVDDSVMAYGLSVEHLTDVYVGGSTTKSLGGPNAGHLDPFLQKYDSAGNVLWTYQTGGADSDFGQGLSTDRWGNIVMAGGTGGDFGAAYAGANDPWLLLMRDQAVFDRWIGDANLDGEFNSSDLVQVLASGTYEVDVASNWSTGDFNGDGRTTSADLVAALADGGYELGPRTAAVAAVPEPTSLWLIGCGLLLLQAISRRRRANPAA